jgi:insertion element IS1 protein InsB
MCWNLTRYGRLSIAARTSAGSGWLSAAELARSSLTALADLEGAIGGRGQKTCRVLWRRIPKAYKKSVLYTDFWRAYAKVLPAAQHQATGKGEGQTCHIERFNNILRQRMARFVRKTLSFSKSDQSHENCLRLFLHEYNVNKLN